MGGVTAWLRRIGSGLGACGVALLLFGFAATPAGAQAWWDSYEIGRAPELKDGFLPVPSIATSLPYNGDPAGYRKWLGQRGVVYGLDYTSDVLSNVHGGKKTGTI